jgi:hypothetical protein
MANQTSEIKISHIALMRVLFDGDADYKVEVSNSYIADGHAYLGIRIIDPYNDKETGVAFDDIYYDMNDMTCYVLDEKLLEMIQKSLGNAANKYIQKDLFTDDEYHREKALSCEVTKEDFVNRTLPI